MMPLVYDDELPLPAENTGGESNSRMLAENNNREHTSVIPAKNADDEHSSGMPAETLITSITLEL